MDRRQLLAYLALPLAQSVNAQASAPPAGPVVLTLSGRVGLPNQGDKAVFDMSMLERLPQHSLNPPTPWYPQPRKFTGPLLRDVLAAAGSKGSLLKAVALNDYRVEIPADDADRFDMVLARLLDDKPMTVREKGPLFIIYPFEQHADLRKTLYYSRCAWQLKAIEVL